MSLKTFKVTKIVKVELWQLLNLADIAQLP